jgi:C1A family cysteine protease
MSLQIVNQELEVPNTFIHDSMQVGGGRLFAPDDRDGSYPMRRALPSRGVHVPEYRYWVTAPVMDQGATSQCVAYTWRQWLNSAPIMDRLSRKGPDVRTIYKRAQQIDEWYGEDYDGTSVRAGAKVMVEHGLLKEYVWSVNAAEIALFILTKGTVTVGTNWYESMFQPDQKGLVSIARNSESVGGHAYLCTGYNKTRGLFRFINSWGASYGINGRFYMTGETFERLLREDGESCAGLEVI